MFQITILPRRTNLEKNRLSFRVGYFPNGLRGIVQTAAIRDSRHALNAAFFHGLTPVFHHRPCSPVGIVRPIRSIDFRPTIIRVCPLLLSRLALQVCDRFTADPEHVGPAGFHWATIMSKPSADSSSRPKTARQNSALSKNLRPCKNCQVSRKGCDRTDWTNSSDSCQNCGVKKNCEPGEWTSSNPGSTVERMEFIPWQFDQSVTPKGRRSPRRSSSVQSTMTIVGSPASTILETPGKSDLPLPAPFMLDDPFITDTEFYSSPILTQTMFAEGAEYSSNSTIAPMTTAGYPNLTSSPYAEFCSTNKLPPTELPRCANPGHHYDARSSLLNSLQSYNSVPQLLPQPLPPFNPASSSLYGWDCAEKDVQAEGAIRVRQMIEDSRSGFTQGQ